MTETWTVQFTLNGLPDDAYWTSVQEEIDEFGIDGSVTALPDTGQWLVSFGVVDFHADTALHEASLLLAKVVHDIPPIAAVEVLSLAELERRATEPTMPELWGAAEIADELGVTRQRVHQLRSLPAFPEPLVQVAAGPLWDARAVRKFARDWPRKPGRPAIVGLGGSGTLTAG